VGGRTVEVQPDTQIVELMVLWVTTEYVAPGWQNGSGSGRYAWGAHNPETSTGPPREIRGISL
jgi:hypothetical protein